MATGSNKFAVKKNLEGHPPRRVLSVVNLIAADFIATPARDMYGKFPILKPKVSRRRSEIIRQPNQKQPEWIVHYREHVARQLKRPEMTNDLRQRKVTFSFCEFLKKKEFELKKLKETQPKSLIDNSPAKYQD